MGTELLATQYPPVRIPFAPYYPLTDPQKIIANGLIYGEYCLLGTILIQNRGQVYARLQITAAKTGSRPRLLATDTPPLLRVLQGNGVNCHS